MRCFCKVVPHQVFKLHVVLPGLRCRASLHRCQGCLSYFVKELLWLFPLPQFMILLQRGAMMLFLPAVHNKKVLRLAWNAQLLAGKGSISRPNHQDLIIPTISLFGWTFNKSICLIGFQYDILHKLSTSNPNKPQTLKPHKAVSQDGDPNIDLKLRIMGTPKRVPLSVGKPHACFQIKDYSKS